MKTSFNDLDSRLRGNDGGETLALPVAESDSKDKDVVIRLVMNMLAGVQAKESAA